jgi:WXG100 family type VII secretion target
MGGIGQILIDYAQVQSVAKDFSDLSSELEQAKRQIVQKTDELRHGGWTGQGAKKFYNEMDQTVLPALKRAHEAMHYASERVRRLEQEFHTCEDELKPIMSRFGT